MLGLENLFTANQSLFQRIVGDVTKEKLEQVRVAVIELLRGGGDGA